MGIKQRLYKEDFKSEDLDDLVIDAATRLASNTNNDGMSNQIDFLYSCGWSDSDILKELNIEQQNIVILID